MGHGVSTATQRLFRRPDDDELSMTASHRPPAGYRIRIRGHLDPSWLAWYDSLTVTAEDDGTTELVGSLVDQAALFGLLARLRDLGAMLPAVEPFAGGDPPAG